MFWMRIINTFKPTLSITNFLYEHGKPLLPTNKDQKFLMPSSELNGKER